jgi:hypothetical protein
MAPLADGSLSAQIERRDLEKFRHLKLKLPISPHLMSFTASSPRINMLIFVNTTTFIYKVNGTDVWFELSSMKLLLIGQSYIIEVQLIYMPYAYIHTLEGMAYLHAVCLC